MKNSEESIQAGSSSECLSLRLIPMTNTHHATMEELVIGKDLSWMDSFPAVHEPEAEYVIGKAKKQRHKRIERMR